MIVMIVIVIVVVVIIIVVVLIIVIVIIIIVIFIVKVRPMFILRISKSGVWVKQILKRRRWIFLVHCLIS